MYIGPHPDHIGPRGALVRSGFNKLFRQVDLVVNDK